MSNFTFWNTPFMDSKEKKDGEGRVPFQVSTISPQVSSEKLIRPAKSCHDFSTQNIYKDDNPLIIDILKVFNAEIFQKSIFETYQFFKSSYEKNFQKKI